MKKALTQVLISDRFTFKARALLQASGYFLIQNAKTPSLHTDDLSQVNVLIIRSKTKIDESVLTRAPNLKLVVTSTSGFDHIDLLACQKREIKVAFTPEANVASAAELTWALALACARTITDGHQLVQSGRWSQEGQVQHREGIQLAGLTYGVIGLGRIGMRVAQIAKAFQMQVVAFDPYCSDQNFLESGAERVSLEEVLKLSDVLSLHVPLTRETQRILNASTLEYLHRGAIVVNTSRGAVLDEQDIYMALQKGWILSLGLDVYQREPLSRDSNLLRSDRVVFSPHVGARTEAAYESASLDAARQVISFVEKGSVTHSLPPQEAWYTSPKGFN